MVATTLVTACPPPSPMLFLETPLYSHYHLFLRSFHARSWKSFRLSRTPPPSLPPCPARFPLVETSRVLPSSPLPVKSSNAVAIFGIPYPPPPSPFPSWNKKGRAQSRQKISKSLDKGVLETPLASLATPIFLYQSKLRLRGFEETEEEELWTMFSIFVVVLNLPKGGGGEASFREWNSVEDCKINRERSPGLTLDWILTLWKCLIDIISVRMESLQGRRGMLGWFTKDWRRRVLFPPPLLLEMLSGFNVWLSSNGWTKFVWGRWW